MSADLEAFARAMGALEPYLDDLVVIGGWAHRLYPLHEGARDPGFSPLMTEDADIASAERLRARGRSIPDRLSEAGFAPTFKGDDRPPVTHYQLVSEGGAASTSSSWCP